MATKAWEVVQVCYCDHVRQQVSLEAEVIFPADLLPDSCRVVAHRCSLGKECNKFEQSTCVWAGTNPGNDPFRQ